MHAEVEKGTISGDLCGLPRLGGVGGCIRLISIEMRFERNKLPNLWKHFGKGEEVGVESSIFTIWRPLALGVIKGER